MSRRAATRSYMKFMPLALAASLLCVPYRYQEPVREYISGSLWSLHALFSPPSHDLKLLEDETNQAEALLADLAIERKKASVFEKLASFGVQKKNNQQIVLEAFFCEDASGRAAIWAALPDADGQDFSHIEKGSPAVSSGALLGYVDYVGTKMVRLASLFDPSCPVAVRVRRSASQKTALLEEACSLYRSLSAYASQQPLDASLDKGVKALEAVVRLLKKHEEEPFYHYLAHGMLTGSAVRGGGSNIDALSTDILGTGFTCDFDRKNSPKRDLRTGRRQPQDEKILIIKPGDLLETSGLDGRFPRGIPVATVSKVIPLEEGASFYTIEASPLIQNLSRISALSILPKKPDEQQQLPDEVERILSLLQDQD